MIDALIGGKLYGKAVEIHMTRDRATVVEGRLIAVKDFTSGRCCVAFQRHLFHVRILRDYSACTC